MSNSGDDPQKPETSDGVVSRSARTLFRAISSGASTVARSAASAASSVVNRDTDSLHDKVLWAGFDKLEKEDGNTRRVLLLAFRSGFQIWDVEDTDNVHLIVSAHDGHAAFMQMLPYPLVSQDDIDDVFSESRPLLAVCGDSSWVEILDRETASASDNPESETVVPTHVNVYSLKSQSYVHTLKFQSVIYTIRCSSRIVAVLQADQIHCFDAKTLVEEYNIDTNSIAYGSLGVGYGPLAVGPRWIAYSGSRVAESSSTVFTSELVPLSSSPNVAQFARESSKHIAYGIARSLSRMCTEALPNPYIPGLKGIGFASDKAPDAGSMGMVVIKDIVNKSVISQFKAHNNPIAALSFDPSGMLLVSASTQGHNINVFRIMPRTSNTSDATKESFMHMFSLHRGYTYAVIQDISFSNESSLIVVSSSRGTSHVFEINPEREGHLPVPLSAVIRIRSGDTSGWIGTVSGAAAAAAGMVGGGGGSLSGSTTSTFSYCIEQNKNTTSHFGSDNNPKRNLLVFAPTGCMTQYALKAGDGHDEGLVMTGIDASESGSETEGPVVTIRRWYMIQNRSRREMQDQHYGGGGYASDSISNVFPEIGRKQSTVEPWKVTKKGKARVEDNHQLYVSETELRMYQPSQLSLWETENCRFQKLVLDVDEEGGGEMEIEREQTQTIEATTRDLRPVWG